LQPEKALFVRLHVQRHVVSFVSHV
jgi:hypothetical protein